MSAVGRGPWTRGTRRELGDSRPGRTRTLENPDSSIKNPASRIKNHESRTTSRESRIENQESPVASHQSPVARRQSGDADHKTACLARKPVWRVATRRSPCAMCIVHALPGAFRGSCQCPVPVPSANVPVSRVSRFEVRVSKFGVRFSVSGFWFTFEFRIFERPGEPGGPGASSAPGPRALRRICCVRVGKRVCDENVCTRIRTRTRPIVVVDVRTTETECRTNSDSDPVLDMGLESWITNDARITTHDA